MIDWLDFSSSDYKTRQLGFRILNCTIKYIINMYSNPLYSLMPVYCYGILLNVTLIKLV